MKWEICCKVKKNIEAFKQFCDKKIFQAGLRVFLKKMNLVNLSDFKPSCRMGWGTNFRGWTLGKFLKFRRSKFRYHSDIIPKAYRNPNVTQFLWIKPIRKKCSKHGLFTACTHYHLYKIRHNCDGTIKTRFKHRNSKFIIFFCMVWMIFWHCK